MMALLVMVVPAWARTVSSLFSAQGLSLIVPRIIVGQPARNGKRFNPGFPVTCPFITAVGATQVDPGNTVDDPEGACEQVIYSGGGFSNYFAMPDYQKEAVAYYLENYYPQYPPDIWNASGTVRILINKLGACTDAMTVSWIP